MTSSNWFWRLVLPLHCIFGLVMLRVAQWLRFQTQGDHAVASLAALGVVLLAEVLVTARFEGLRFRRNGPRPGAWTTVLRWTGLAVRLGLWTALFVLAVEWPAAQNRSDETVFLRGIPLRLWPYAGVFLSVLPWLTALAAGLWLALFEFIVVRRRALRGLVMMIAPTALLVGLTHVVYWHGTATTTLADVTAQPDVELLFAPGEEASDAEHEVWAHPRTLRLIRDGKVAIAVFGTTLGGQSGAPCLWKIDLESGRYETLETASQVWAVVTDPSEETLYAFTWHRAHALVVDIDSFEIVGEASYRHLWPYPCVEPTDAFTVGPYAYVALTALPSLLKLDMRTGVFVSKLDLTERGLFEDGDMCCFFSTPTPDGTVFVVGADGTHTTVFQVDLETLEVLARHDLPALGRHISLAPGEGGGHTLYVPEEYGDGIWRIDTRDWRHERLCRSSGNWVKRVLPDGDNDRLLVFERNTGNLTTLAMDCRVERQLQLGTGPVPDVPGADHVHVLSSLGLFRVKTGPGLSSRHHPERAREK